MAVIGAGPAGMCTMMCARLYDPGKIIALDTDENRLDVVKDNHLADFCINPGEISEKDLETRSGSCLMDGEQTGSLRWQEEKIPSRLPGRSPGPMQWSP